MGHNPSVPLGDHFENFTDNEVSEDRYVNASEVIRTGLWLLEEEENKTEILRNAIKEGISSGPATGFNPKIHLTALKAAKRKNGFKKQNK